MAATITPASLQRSQLFSLFSAPRCASGVFQSSHLCPVIRRYPVSIFWKLKSEANSEAKERGCGRIRSLRCDDYSQINGEDFFEGTSLGIHEHWDVTEVIKRKANSVEIPLSLRIIKKKKQFLEQEVRDASCESHCSVTKALSSLLSIVRLVHSSSLQKRSADFHMRQRSRDETDLYISFVWIFQKVYSRTPAMMVNLMLLFADFAVCSVRNSMTTADRKQNELIEEEEKVEEDSMEVERVQLEPDDYEEYLRTEISYQMNLAQEPNNSLLLLNYAQFIYLVSRDYDRAEEYFQRAVKAEPKDAEALSRYASFLWVARKDEWAAEEMYLQAMMAEPGSSYHASTYASFLWSTGGEDTCFLPR